MAKRKRFGIVTHGHSLPGSPCYKEYKAWAGAKARCFSKNNKDYFRYGGRGITVCSRWKDSFENFISDMGPVPKDHFLDRIDFNGEYSPENCRWANRNIHALNRSGVMVYTVDGVMKAYADIAKANGIHHSTFCRRVKAGWSIEDATTVKPSKQRIGYENVAISHST